jgi:tryptophan 2,3-dioxygenase
MGTISLMAITAKTSKRSRSTISEAVGTSACTPVASDTLFEAEAKLVASGPTGVGGRCLHAHRGTPAQLSGAELERTVRQWRPGHAEFPFAAVVAHYQAVGRNSVRPEVAAMLRDLHGRYRDDPLLAAWLPMTFDTDHGTYSTYVGLDYFDHVVQSAQQSADCERVDAYIAAAAIDLALVEVKAAAASPHGPQLVRTRAATRVVTQLAQFAPDYALDPSLSATGADALAHPGDHYEAFASAAALAMESVPNDIATAVRLTLLPTTRLHDEQMFIRCIQIFEGLYRQVATAISSATRHLLAGETALAIDCLDRASGRLEAIPMLFRVLTTMPIDAFSVIRGFTDGRSAVQSRAYREIQFSCAPGDRSLHHIQHIDAGEATLQCAYLSTRSTLADAMHFEKSMRRLDRAWGAMKRGHWGITRKIIGSVPGTGGTAGASYLQTAAKSSLFPGLPEAA